MVVIKVFDSRGVKTVKMLGNVNEQDYDDPVEIDEDVAADQDVEAAEEDN